MVELSGRKIVGVPKITERHATEFNALVSAVDACGTQPVRLDLTDLDIRNLWKRTGFFELAVRPNLNLVLDPETASILKSYLIITKGVASYEIREPNVVPDVEDPRIQEKGEKYAKYAKVQSKSIRFDVADIGLDTLSSIGLSGQCVQRALEIVAKQAFERELKLIVDFTDIVFEGGCDVVFAETLVESKKQYKALPIKVIGDEGIAEYVRVLGRVRLPAELKINYFKRIQPGTVLRLNTYRTAFRSDIAGRKGSGVLAGASIVLFGGVSGTDAMYVEIPTHRLYLEQDLIVLGESLDDGDTQIPRVRNLSELGIHRVCTGSHGHFGPLATDEFYQISDESGRISEIVESDFVARGLRALGIPFNEEFLANGVVIPRKKKL